MFVMCSKRGCRPDAGAAEALPGQDVFRVRLTGPEIHLLDVLYCDLHTAYAQYALAEPGGYHAEVLHLYENFTYAAHTPMQRDYLLGAHAFEVTAGESVRLAHHAAGGVPPCSRGRWVLGEEYRDELRMTCTMSHDTYACGEAVAQLSKRVADASRLAWRPYDCPPLEEPAPEEVERCLRKRHVCFFGDSHMRHIYNSFVAMTEGGGRGDDFWRRERKTDGMVMDASRSSYFRNTWGDPGDMSACTDSFVNFGQWPASYEAGNRSWTAQQYASKVGMLAEALAAAKSEGKRVYWVTTNPFPLHAHLHVLNTDWRSDPELLLFNAIANRAMATAGLDTVDVWHMAAPVAELSYDKSHFKGTLGYYIVLQFLSTVCRDAAPVAAPPMIASSHR
ncbi:hypothetical protein WJX81_001217 [Elliptochloris bilobata]|uniref:Uncharacterized protein n=1 Tax=Elliptochloris bilobata TaxID=381761 RepID=A0AAW1R325_9CHLO